ncbi:pentatricopeptide repeat-containing protein At2g29760, chloroplastic-like [Silene latifolia]|uniref:pentatricopeptide repeat-containing protein At2g29760, chloroplastic-like n=1 Tax=Silene latifolia TaxID=37657 RepID=UPI003D77CC33
MKNSLLSHLFIKSRFITSQRSSFSLHSIRFHNHSTLPNSWNTSTSTMIITNPILQSMQKCATMSQLKQIQAQMTRKGLFFHVFPVSRIIAFCALSDHGDINYAHLIFDQILSSNVYIWNTMIKGFCRAGNYAMGVSFFRKMVRDEVEFDGRSFVFALKAFAGVSGFREGRGVHCMVSKLGFGEYVLVGNGLIHFYADGGFLSFARQVFDECRERDVVTWTAMIDGYVQRNCPDEALSLFGLMLCGEVVPNEVTMITLLSACALKGNLKLGKIIHSYIEKVDVECTLNLMNSMLDMYVKCGGLTAARRLFELMERRDVFSWTSMVNGYARHGELEMARRYFNEMPVKNVVAWNAMIAGYSQNNQPKDALELFQAMVEGGLVPIEATLVSVLSACAQSSCLDLGRRIHSHYIHQNRIKLSPSLGNALIDMYAKSGQIDMAEELFNEMPKRDLVTWNTMIVGYADHGNANKALNLFDKMRDLGIKPDHITYIGILSACSHAGLVSIGRKHFLDMEQVFGLLAKVEHYACMIDLLGRGGLLGEAFDMIKAMPMEPDEAVWGALLNACRMHGNVDLGKIAAEKLIDLDPEDSGTYMLLANILSREGRWEDVSSTRNMMREKGVKKTRGSSSVEVEGEFHEFSVADDSHPRSEEIYKVLKEIFILSDLEEDLFQHVSFAENEDMVQNG